MELAAVFDAVHAAPIRPYLGVDIAPSARTHIVHPLSMRGVAQCPCHTYLVLEIMQRRGCAEVVLGCSEHLFILDGLSHARL